jgi:putative DNA primase/helicase
VHRLAELLDTLPEARLIVIDPMSAFLGGTDSHKAAEVRAAMGAISKLAETRRVALLSINHLNKSSGASAMARVSGSGAFVAQPRAAYIVTRDKDDQALRVMAPLKNNIGDDTTAYFFKVVSVTVDGGIETSRVEWQERTEQLSADEALEQKAPKGAGAESLRAMDYIRATLAAGAKPAREMEAGAKTAGISAATLRRAREALRVMSGKEHGKRDGQWVWALPDPPRTAEDIFK